MFRFGLQNLRRLQSVKPIDLKPITILVGKNSSGKSTFLRALPLLRQSVTTRTSSPILWWGDWVDFGDFEGAVHQNNSKSEISFVFGIDDFKTEPSIMFDGNGYYNIDQLTLTGSEVEVKIGKHNTGTRVTNIKLTEKSNDAVFLVSIDSENRVDHVEIDGVVVEFDDSDFDFILGAGSILPQVFFRPKKVEPSPSFGSLPRYGRNYARQKISELERNPIILAHTRRR